jgi:hypothetical protein
MQESANRAFFIIFALLVPAFRIRIRFGTFEQFVKFAVGKPDTRHFGQ